MNAAFMSKMLEAKRLEVEAFAELVPPEVRRIAAAGVRVCADTALSVLEAPAEEQGAAQRTRAARPITID